MSTVTLKLLFAAIALACVAARSEFDFANTAADKVEMDLNKVPVLGSRFVSTLQLLAFCREVYVQCLYHIFFSDFRVEDEKLVSTLSYISRFSLFIREIYGFEERFS